MSAFHYVYSISAFAWIVYDGRGREIARFMSAELAAEFCAMENAAAKTQSLDNDQKVEEKQ